MINRITWRPTVEVMNCDCIIVFDQVHSEAGVFISETFVEVKQKCAAHKDVPDNELLGVIKNNPDAEVHIRGAIERALQRSDDFGINSLDQNGNPTGGRETKPDVWFKIMFSGTGKQRRAGLFASKEIKAPLKQDIKDAVKIELGIKAEGRVDI